MAGTELATAYLTLIPSLRGATKQIESQLGGVDTSKAGSAIGKSLGGSIGKSLDLSAIGAGLSDAGQKLADVGGKLTAGITVPLVGATAAAGTFALKTASAAETTEISFTTMLGSEEAALSMMEELADFAAHTPFELSGLQTATRQLLAYGFTAEDVIPMLTAVGDATAALGTGQAGIESVTRALGQMQTRGKVSAEEMLQLTEAGIPAWEYLARAIGTDTAGAMDAVTAGAVSANEGIQAIVSGMENDFGGMMEEQSKTVEGLFSNLSDAIEQPLMKLRESDAYERFADSLSDVVDAAGPFVESLLPHMEDGLDAVSGVLDAATDAMDAFADMGEDGQSQLIGMATAAAAAGPALTVAGKGMQLLGSATKGAGSLIKAGQKAVGTLGDKLLDFATAPETAGTVLGKFAGVVSAIPGPAKLAGVAIGGVLVSGIIDYYNWATKADREAEVQAEALRVLTSASETAGAAMEGASEGPRALGTEIYNLGEEIQENWQSIADLGSAFDEIDAKASAQVTQLSAAKGAIADYNGQADLSTQQLGSFRAAIETVNDECGTNYEVVKDAGGAYYVMQDGAQVAADEIYGLIDAQIEQARVNAQLEKLESLYAEQAEQAQEYAAALQQVSDAQEAYDAALEKYGDVGSNWALDDLEEAKANLAEVETQLNSTGDAIAGVETGIGNMTAASQGAVGGFDALVMGSAGLNTLFAQTGLSMDEFADDLEASGVSLEAFSALSDTQLMKLASGWDGTTDSIIAALDEMEIEVGDAGLSAATALADGMASGQVDVDSATRILKAAATGDWSSVSSQMSSAGISLPQSVADGITSNSFTASGATNTMLSMIALQLTGGDVPAAAQLLGHDIDQGLADGIANGTLSDEQAALLGEDVINRAKDTLESHSPSQAFYRIGSDVDAGLSLGISGNTFGPLGAIGQLGQFLIDRISGLPGEAQATGSGASGGLSAGLAAGIGSVAASAQSLASSASSGVAGTPSDLSGKGRSASSNFASGIGSGVGATRTSADRLSSAASNMGSGNSWQWGNHLGGNFASGIRAASGLVSGAASFIASTAKSILGFSTPDDGPWSGSEKGGYTSGLHLGENFAAGMMAAVPSVRGAAAQLATAAGVPGAGDSFARRGTASAPYDNRPGGQHITQNFNTKVVRSDEDLYTAAPIIYRNAIREARLALR